MIEVVFLRCPEDRNEEAEGEFSDIRNEETKKMAGNVDRDQELSF